MCKVLRSGMPALGAFSKADPSFFRRVQHHQYGPRSPDPLVPSSAASFFTVFAATRRSCRSCAQRNVCACIFLPPQVGVRRSQCWEEKYRWAFWSVIPRRVRGREYIRKLTPSGNSEASTVNHMLVEVFQKSFVLPVSVFELSTAHKHIVDPGVFWETSDWSSN